MSGEVKSGSVCPTWNKQAKIGTSSPFLAEAGVISETGSRISQSSKQQPLGLCVGAKLVRQRRTNCLGSMRKPFLMVWKRGRSHEIRQ